jgi:hypothetical protein
MYCISFSYVRPQEYGQNRKFILDTAWTAAATGRPQEYVQDRKFILDTAWTAAAT